MPDPSPAPFPELRPLLDRTLVVRTLGLALLALLIAGCALTLLPFLTAILWGLILTVSFAPLHAGLTRRIGRRLATTVIVAVPVLAVLLPLFLFADGIASNFMVLTAKAEALLSGNSPPSAPEWLNDIPLFGHDLHDWLNEVLHDEVALTEQLRKLIAPTRDFLLLALRKLGAGLLDLTLSVIVMGVLLNDLHRIGVRTRQFLAQFAGTRAAELLAVASATVRGVVAGLLGTALAQALLAGVGFAIAGTGSAVFYGFVTFFLSFVPFGPVFVWGPLAWQLYGAGSTGMAIFLAVWGAAVVGTIDNILKPLLIGRGLELPLLLVFLGVLGGALSFGLIGVFVGPVLLAVGQNLARLWFVEGVARRPEG